MKISEKSDKPSNYILGYQNVMHKIFAIKNFVLLKKHLTLQYILFDGRYYIPSYHLVWLCPLKQSQLFQALHNYRANKKDHLETNHSME